MHKLNTLWRRLTGPFLKNVLKLSLRALSGRLIALTAVPALTLLYAPEDFAVLAVYLAVVSTVTVAACLRLEIVIPEGLAVLPGNPKIEAFRRLIPLGTAMAGRYSAFQFWTTQTRITQAFLGVAPMLSLCWVGVAPIGLHLGNAINIGAGGVGQAAGAWRNERPMFRSVSFSNLRQTFRRNYRYSQTTPSH